MDHSAPEHTDENESLSSRLLALLTQSHDSALNSDARGQSNIIGVIILLGFLLATIGAAQVQLAPQVQTNTEFQHASNIISDMAGVQADTIEVTSSGVRRSTTIKMGATYPRYLILSHPPSPQGTLVTSEPRALELRNAEAIRSETRDYHDGTTKTYEHERLRFVPQYNQFDSAGDTTLEQGVLYEDFNNSTRIVATPNIINGNQINLVALNGNIYQGSQDTKIVETVPLSASSETTLVEGGGDQVQLRFESDLAVDTWRDILQSEIAATGPNPNDDKYVESIIEDSSTGEIVISLESSGTYELNQAKLQYKLAEQASPSGSAYPEPEYLTTDQITNKTAREGETIELVVQARDRYDNPVANSVIEATATQGTATTVDPVSRSNGEVTVLYSAPDSGAPINDVVVVSYRDRSGDDKYRVEYQIQVQS